MNKIVKTLLLLLLLQTTVFAKDYTLLSPDRSIRIKITTDKAITWSVLRNDEILLKPSPMSLLLSDGRKLGADPLVLKSDTRSVNQSITATIPVRNKLIPEVYNELRLVMKGGYSIEFRTYNDGVAYRFVTTLGKETIEINNEEAAFNFNENCKIWLPKEADTEFQGHYEGEFQATKLANIAAGTYGYLPLYVATDKTKMVITESDLQDYPNMFLFGTGGNSLIGHFPKVPLKLKPTGNIHLDDIIAEKASYQAKIIGNRNYPWRVVIISGTDKGLLETDLVYKLASPNVLKDTKWIKPGKVAWDWWTSRPPSTDTYRSFIDFASAYGLEYVILDEGWAKSTTNILESNPEIDLPEVIRYAKEKNVGLIFWTLWKPLDQNMEAILAQYEKWGIKGVKVDFMARADQDMVNFYDRVASATAKHHLLLDLHGAFKPVGLNRKYPNLLNYEGVKGMEQSKWSEIITPEHDTTLPFTRMVAGPMDFTPGAMLNSNKGEFQINWGAPMSQGTRAHQTAMYVVYNAPLQMLCDNPANYLKEPVYTKYLSRFPTTWDRTIALEGKIGEYVLVAKNNGDNWYIGGMTNWDARTFQLPLTFLDGKTYKVEILKDGLNVKKQASDYQIEVKNLGKGDVLKVDMASGGGYAAILTPINK